MSLFQSFQFKNFNHVVIFGFNRNYKKIEQFNFKKNLKTIFISTPLQKKNFDKKFNVFTFEKLNRRFQNFLKKNTVKQRTLFISMGSRFIFKENIIKKVFDEKIINFHNTRLPFDKGGGGYSWRILKNDRICNLLVHKVEKKIDAGKIIDFKTHIFSRECKIPKDFEEFEDLKFFEFYKKFIENLLIGKKYILKSNLDYLGSYYPRLNTELNGFIDWNYDFFELYNFINAFDEPYSGASTFCSRFNEKRILKLKSVHLHGNEINSHPFMNGLVIRKTKDYLVVSISKNQNLIIENVLYKNKNILSQIEEGDRFYTPVKYLNKSNAIRVKYKK